MFYELIQWKMIKKMRLEVKFNGMTGPPVDRSIVGQVESSTGRQIDWLTSRRVDRSTG